MQPFLLPTEALPTKTHSPESTHQPPQKGLPLSSAPRTQAPHSYNTTSRCQAIHKPSSSLPSSSSPQERPDPFRNLHLAEAREEPYTSPPTALHTIPRCTHGCPLPAVGPPKESISLCCPSPAIQNSSYLQQPSPTNAQGKTGLSSDHKVGPHTNFIPDRSPHQLSAR